MGQRPADCCLHSVGSVYALRMHIEGVYSGGTCCIAWGELGGGMGSKSVWSVVGVIDGHSMHAGQRLDTSEVVMVNA